MDIEDFYKFECESLPGSGSCSAMFTSCSMATIVEGLGLLAPNSASPPMVNYSNELNPEKIQNCKDTARICMDDHETALSKVDIKFK